MDLDQREIYKLVEDLTAGEHNSELAMLETLVRDIVDHNTFQINGGRVWKLNAAKRTYVLMTQYGNVEQIPSNYKIRIDSMPALKDIINSRTTLNRESDPVLIEKGITIYSVTGVGDIIKLSDGKYYEYLLGFNAPEILQSFYETLNIISGVATIKIRDIAQRNAQAKYSRELEKAAEIQRNIFPEHYLEFHDYKIYGVCIPASEIGGDYFDYIRNTDDEDEDRIGVLIGDAASKGLSAAIQALFVTGAIRMASFFSPKLSSLLSRLNNLIYDNFPYERFVTLFYCELSLSSKRLVMYANAGHTAPIHYSPDRDQFEQMPPTGGLLGIVQHQKYRMESLLMHEGDILALYTDGISEAHNYKNELYGEEKIMELIKKHKDLPAKEIALKIIEDVQKFSINCTYADDMTLIIIKRDSMP